MKTTSPLQPLLSTKIVRTSSIGFISGHISNILFMQPFSLYFATQMLRMLVKMIQQVPQRLRLFVFSHRRIGEGLTSKVCITHGLLESPSELTFTPLARQTLCAQAIKYIQQ